MVNWVLVVAGLVFLFIFFQTRDLKHKIFTFIFLAFFVFLFFGMSEIGADSEKDLSSFGGLFEVAKLYLVWLQQTFSSFTSVTGDVLKLDWANFSEEG